MPFDVSALPDDSLVEGILSLHDADLRNLYDLKVSILSNFILPESIDGMADFRSMRF